MKELEAIFKGNVQDVYFRSSVQKIAARVNLNGYAKNLTDGSVEVRAVGDKKELEYFVEEILKEPGSGSVSSYTAKFNDVVTTYRNFLIL